MHDNTNLTKTSSLRNELSLASLMFFGPFVNYLIKKNNGFDLSESDKIFVSTYIVLGTINFSIAVITLIVGVVSNFVDYEWLNIVFLIISSLLLGLLLLGSIGVFANISLHKLAKNEFLETSEDSSFKSPNAIRDYLPFVNLYIWYQNHDFDGKHPILKESLLVWSLFGFVSLTGNIWFVSIFLVLIILRIVSLTIVGDVLPQSWNMIISSLFYKNIEEVWGWFIDSVSNLRKDDLGSTVDTSTTHTYQKLYSYLYDIKKHGIIRWEYIVLLIITGFVVYSTYTSTGFGFIVLGVSILRGRYLIMVFIWSHLPPLPLIHDIFRGMQSLFVNKVHLNK